MNQPKEKDIVVKLLTDDDGSKYLNPKWHGIFCPDGAQRTICTQEVFGYGESSLKYLMKKGNITCLNCIGVIEGFKKIKNYTKPK